jgi:hypothetical protein
MARPAWLDRFDARVKGGSMATQTFQSVLASGHKGDAAQVPFGPGTCWSVSARPLRPGRRGFPVRATLNGHGFESSIVARSRKFWLLVPAAISQGAGIRAGESGSFSVTPAASPGSARKPA